MTKLAIFDLDGTLLDTAYEIGHATNHALKTLNFPIRELDEYYNLCGKGIYNLFRDALPANQGTEENVAKMAKLFLEYYEQHMNDYTKPYPGIPEMLEKLEQKGIKLAIASNKYQAGTEKIVKHFFGKLQFVKILGQRDGKPIKPDPLIVEEIIEAAGSIDKEEVIYIGDSDVDMKTGRNAGVKTIGVSWGFRGEEELKSYFPWHIAHNASELINYILN